MFTFFWYQINIFVFISPNKYFTWQWTKLIQFMKIYYWTKVFNNLFHVSHSIISKPSEKFEDAKWVTLKAVYRRTNKKQFSEAENTNNRIQNTTQKTQDWATLSPKNQGKLWCSHIMIYAYTIYIKYSDPFHLISIHKIEVYKIVKIKIKEGKRRKNKGLQNTSKEIF